MSNTEQETKITDLLERDGVAEETTSQVENKPYILRKLNSKDISPMIKVLKKIDLKKLKESIRESNLMDIVSNKIKTVSDDENVENEETEENNTNELMKIGGALVFDAIPILLDAVDNAIGDINKLLAGVAGLEVEEVENMDLDIYFNLRYDFITKPEFEGFTKAVSKLMK